MGVKGRFILTGLGAFLLFAYAGAFVVHQSELAIKQRFGRILDSNYTPGLYWRVPIIEEIKKFDGRIHTMETNSERFITIEKKDVLVDSYVKWRISDVAQYFRASGGNQDRTDQLLKERINTSLRDEFGRRTIQDVVSGDRAEIMTKLTKDASVQAADLGVVIVDVRVKQIDLPQEVSESVYERMRAERERVARDLRAQGEEQSERIRADADRQRTVILAEAYKEAEQLRGEGDALAAEI
jgi:modulator of FtsH protease HflC